MAWSVYLSKHMASKAWLAHTCTDQIINCDSWILYFLMVFSSVPKCTNVKKNALWTKFKLISLLLTLKYERKFQPFPQIEWWNHHHWDDVFTTSWSVHNKLWGSLTSIKNNSLAHLLFYKLIGESMVRTPPAWGIYLISHWGHLCQEYTCLPYTKEI